MKDKLKATDLQLSVLKFIYEWQVEFGCPPTHENISTGLGYKSINSATLHANALVTKGYLTKTPNESKTLRLTDKGREAIQ